MILVLDNVDSFVFNLAQGLQALGASVHVRRSDALGPEDVLALQPTAVVLSPGPGTPASAGCCLAVLDALPDHVPVLGVCLGHQAIVEHAGGGLERDARPVHGRATLVHHDGSLLLRGLPSPLPCGRYHSLRARREDLPSTLRTVAWTEEGDIMAIEDTTRPRFGVQFHPESILTPLGDRVLANFLAAVGEPSEVGRRGA